MQGLIHHIHFDGLKLSHFPCQVNRSVIILFFSWFLCWFLPALWGATKSLLIAADKLFTGLEMVNSSEENTFLLIFVYIFLIVLLREKWSSLSLMSEPLVNWFSDIFGHTFPTNQKVFISNMVSPLCHQTLISLSLLQIWTHLGKRNICVNDDDTWDSVLMYY